MYLLQNQYANKSKNYDDVHIEISMLDGTTLFKLDYMNIKTIFWNKEEKYIPLHESNIYNRFSNYENLDSNIIIVSSTPSILIEYDLKGKPDIVQVQIKGEDELSQLYYWDYFIDGDDFLNFPLPLQILESPGNYHVQINFLWLSEHEENILRGNKQYNFNFYF